MNDMNNPRLAFGGRPRKSLAVAPGQRPGSMFNNMSLDPDLPYTGRPESFSFGNGGAMRHIRKPARPMMAAGGSVQNMAEGGMAQGPSHEQGGIAAVQQDTGEQVAEIEGGERVFSQEDTAALEEAAMQIVQMSESGDTQKANDLAMRLGYAVVNMIAAQEQNQAAQEQQMQQGGPQAQGMAPEDAEAMNQFGTEI